MGLKTLHGPGPAKRSRGNGREGFDYRGRLHMSGMPQLLGEPAPRLLDVSGLVDPHWFSAKTHPVEIRNPKPAFFRSPCRFLRMPPRPEIY
jgi:hypothetical protein